MYLLIIFGFGMFVIGLFMLLKPLQFSNGVKAFSEKAWFHSFEIITRLLFGILFLAFWATSPYPILMVVMGAILCFAGVFLIVLGAKRHKQFALLVTRLGKYFRILSVVPIMGGAGLIFFSLVAQP